MSLKENIYRRIIKNSVKSELDGKTVYLKKSRIPILGGEWKEIQPPLDIAQIEKMESEGHIDWNKIKWNKVNLIFGGWKNLIRLVAILVIVGLVILQFIENYRILGGAVECCNKCNGIDLSKFVH